MPEDSYFDVRKSVARRNMERLIILPVFAFAIIWLGRSFIPNDFVWELTVDAIKTWDGWAFIGIILIGTGIFNLIKTAFFAFRARGTTGEWHFRLSREDLLWHVPDHAHGPEIGFETPLSNIKELEFRTISKHEAIDEREYWIHFRDRNPIQLQDYTGISMSWLAAKIEEAGVPYNATVVEG